jgi:hypothetical protein
MKLKGVTPDQLLEMIPESLYQELTDELAVDKWVPKMKATFLFKLLVFSILQTKELSLRVIEENSRSPLLLGLSPEFFAPVSYGAVRARLIQVKVEFFQRLYEFVYQQLAQQLVNSEPKKYQLKLYDSTMVATFAHLLEAMKVGNYSKNKQQVKFTTELTDNLLIKVSFFKDQKYLSENTALKKVIGEQIHKTQEIIVFDLGLSCRKTFQSFSENQIKFVTKGKQNLCYKVIKPLTETDKLPETEHLEFVEDNLAHLFAKNKEEIEQEFRVIKAIRKEDGKVLYLITNILELPAEEIAEIYKKRWEIEVFFKFMKQEMNLTHFVCHDQNAIKVMLYCTLIASMLVLAYKQSNEIKSFKIAKIRFFKELHLEIIEELVDHPNGIVWVKDIIKLNKAQLK